MVDKDVLMIAIEGVFFGNGNDGYIDTHCLGAWCLVLECFEGW